MPRERVVITGVIRSTRVTEDRGGPSCECLLDDGTGEIGLVFSAGAASPGLEIGTRCTVEGTAGMDRRRLVVCEPALPHRSSQPAGTRQAGEEYSA